MTSPGAVVPDVLKPGNRVLIVGNAREGQSAAEFLASREIDVTVSDRDVTERSVNGRITLAPESDTSLDGIDGVITSPGIPSENRLLAGAAQRDLLVTNATELFLELCPCPVVGITGSSGKSTTSAMVASILRASGRHVALGGNIGLPMLDLLEELTSSSVAVTEMSSFQLELVGRSPHVSVVTNLTPNHLDRHRSMDAYAHAKRNIFAFQSDDDIAVVNADDPDAARLADGCRGRRVSFGWSNGPNRVATVSKDVVTLFRAGEEEIVPVSEIPLPGRHNVANTLAAVAVTAQLDVPAAAMGEGIRSFSGLPHRLQFVGRVDGVKFIDDSIATSPERAAVGLSAVSPGIVWIAGGRSKHLPWAPVIAAGSGKVRAVILVGEAKSEIADAISGQWPGVFHYRARNLADAVARARKVARPGDTVLLSPGGTSFDEFRDFEDRGNAFQSAVRELVE